MRHDRPLLQLVDQLSPESAPVDVQAAVAAGFEQAGVHALVTRGDRIAITAGSRGIRDLPAVLRAAVAAVREAGGDPFIAPCMGSHGGATAEGQRATLESLGVTAESVGAPVVSSMDVVAVGESSFGVPVWAARDLAEADGVVVVNRVKPHTDFHGEVESGLVKMLVIGAGKHAGALSAHNLTVRHGFPAVLRDHGELLLEGLPVLCGIALVEDQRERTALLEVLRPDEFFTREHELLARAYELLPRLPFDQLDVLVVDRLGKDVSGTGMDTNVIGRCSFWGGGEKPVRPRITRIFVRGLTAATHGNACGIGMADFTTARCAAEVRPGRHGRQLRHLQLPRGRAHPHRLRLRPGGGRGRPADRRHQGPGRGAAGVDTRHGAPGAHRRVRGAAGRGAGRRGAAPRRPALPSALRRERRPALALRLTRRARIDRSPALQLDGEDVRCRRQLCATTYASSTYPGMG